MSTQAATAWDSPTWVLALMHHPHETALLELIGSGQETQVMRRADWLQGISESANRGASAGHVLALLYAMDQAPWRLTSEPSIGKAVAVVSQMHEQGEQWRRQPKGKSEIYKRIADYRRVWHLWAAWRFIRDDADSVKQPSFIKDFPALMGMARAVQQWALAWRPKRVDALTSIGSALLDEDAYLVPNSIAAREPQWGESAPQWMVVALKNYKPRNRA